MSCAAVSVNRTLGVFAIVWMLMAVKAIKTDAPADTDRTSALLQPERSALSPAHPHELPAPCELGEEQGLLPPLCLAFTQQNRKKARMMNSR